jgi:ABC-2 type transport system ATP-binding protein
VGRSAVIEVENLVYEYPSKRALKGINLSVRPNTITALVGPNGAGKTTLLRCLAALDTPYDGTVRIANLNTRDDPRAIHAQLGYLPDFFGLYDALSVERCLIFAARAHGLGTTKASKATEKAAERVGLSDRMAKPAAELSRGLRQRLAIAQAIVHEPTVLLLDEPAAGLDPMARRDLSKLLVSLKEGGITLVVSSHILSELEDYSDEMIIMEDGRIVGGAPVQLRKQQRALIRIQLASAHSDLATLLSRHAGIEVLKSDDISASVRFLGDAQSRVNLLRSLIAQGLEIMSFGDAPHQLEAAYFAEVRRETLSS